MTGLKKEDVADSSEHNSSEIIQGLLCPLLKKKSMCSRVEKYSLIIFTVKMVLLKMFINKSL